MSDILTLATAGMKLEQFSGMARLKYPRVDFIELQHYVNDDRLDYTAYEKTHLGTVAPENVTLMECLPLTQLKQHYSQAKFVVLPLYDQVFSAGATVALEAACMGRAIIATRTQGIVDYIIDGETGILVDPGDEKAMRFAIEDLLAHPNKAGQLGDNARRRVEQELNLDIYVERIAQLLQTFL